MQDEKIWGTQPPDFFVFVQPLCNQYQKAIEIPRNRQGRETALLPSSRLFSGFSRITQNTPCDVPGKTWKEYRTRINDQKGRLLKASGLFSQAEPFVA